MLVTLADGTSGSEACLASDCLADGQCAMELLIEDLANSEARWGLRRKKRCCFKCREGIDITIRC